MDISDLRDKLVGVLGFGQEGRATAAFLLKHQIAPVLFDKKPWEEWPRRDQEYIRRKNLNIVFGPDSLKELRGFDLVFRSPGLPLSKLKHSGVKTVTSQTKWFFEHCPCRIIGVTGTKGKGTTAALISEVLKLQFQLSGSKHGIYLTGNIGKEQPLDILDKLAPDDFVIYELSSFQLQDLTLSPHIGVVLMVTEEHLDYHSSAEEYRRAKTAIVKYQTTRDYAVVNADFSASLEIGNLSTGQKYFFSRKKEVERGCFVKKGMVIFRDEKGHESGVLNGKDLQLRGEHNLENVCAAVLVGIILGIPLDVIKKASASFKGLEHRLEYVSQKGGVKFYNDSISTTPETAMAAIKSFTEPQIVILGGSSKNSDFTALGRAIQNSRNVKAVVLLGREAGRIKEAIFKAGEFSGKIFEGASNMAEIISQALTVASFGDVVLLSPACASFDMFQNYQDRGEQFKEAVNNLPNSVN